MLFDVAKDMSHKMSLNKLGLMDTDLRPYLDVLLVVALSKARNAIRWPKKRNVTALMEEELENFPANEGAKIYDYYGILERDYHLHSIPDDPED